MTDPNPDEPNVHDLFDLTGKVALITGATGHLGSAMARALAEAGCTVAAGSRDLGKAKSFAETLPSTSGAQHVSVALDHLEPDSIERGFDDVVRAAGGIDILVNNGHDPMAKDWRELSAADFNRQLTNATGYFLLSRRLRDHAVARKTTASIVLLGSMYGTVGSYPSAYEGVCSASSAAYHALKGGVVQLTRHLAVYWAPDGVRVNCLSPGPFPGPAAPPAMVERLITHSPMGRMGSAHELKGAIVFLASDASSYITGHNLVVDGGWTAW